ncbi:MAG TPA: hypothetical protein VHB77_17040 [Planctomycetaceae bacterium]|nr:hypothetical protein [Planctomycetaceae bacterium]
MLLRFSGCLMLCAVLLTTTGCSRGGGDGPKLYPVAGRVTFDGKPVASGEIVFAATDGSHIAGAQIVDGEYSLKAAAGKKKVQITALRDVPGEFREDNPGESVQVREMYIPPQYNSQSMLEVNVEKANEDVNFDLAP